MADQERRIGWRQVDALITSDRRWLATNHQSPSPLDVAVRRRIRDILFGEQKVAVTNHWISASVGSRRPAREVGIS